MAVATILNVRDLHVSFDTFAGKVRALRGVAFDLHKGETLAIVGESGSGKSVTGRSIMRLLAPTANIERGSVLFKGADLLKSGEKRMQAIRGREISMIFQDPMTSLDPTMTIGNQIMESYRKHMRASKGAARARALELLDIVGIPDAKRRFSHYPHQFSGGQRQRIVIAIALICDPEILIADEPTTALDVTIQAQILNLMKDIQKKVSTSIIFVTHDLGVVANVADRVAVMYAGRIVEVGRTDEIFYSPRHPYTWGLLCSMPTLYETGERLYAIPGTPPNMLHPPAGDAFHLRNPYAMGIDAKEAPPLFQISETHYAATWLLDPRSPAAEPPEVIQKKRRSLC
ncbi:MAG: ABC transporter ATP-binding protein [Clostridiales bacterium]|jgi:oligopeptide transport system ATP-binding protein|nr:ABC transporter ATP-binding protein [Clostridiales bacterium]